ncbi:MAG: nucleotide pyrophosphohydrolase [Candidatus Lokiarchaeota archaeon]|nr:nucleotide pyrophosphohydrolase [Candidatus Lokiarchaeota archaeon]
MNDKDTKINELKAIMSQFVNERLWNKYHIPKNLAAAISIEANELLELFLWTNPTIEEIKADKKLLTSVEEEVADVIAYVLSICNALDLDITTIFRNKMKKNEIKYPKDLFKGKYKLEEDVI